MVPRRLRQEDWHEFQASLVYGLKTNLKKKKKKRVCGLPPVQVLTRPNRAELLGSWNPVCAEGVAEEIKSFL